MGGHVSDDVRVVCDAGRAGVAGPAVGPGRGAGARLAPRKACRLSAEKSSIRARRIRPGPPSPTSTAPATNNLPWWLRRPPPLGGSSLERQAIRLSSTSTRPASGMRSGATMARRSLVASNHAVLIGTQAELLLELQRRDPVGVRGHQIGGPEPRDQRQLGAVHHRTGRHRGLLATVGAFMGVCLGRERPPPAAAAGRTDEACRPAQDGQVGGFLICRLLRLENAVGTPTGNGGSRSFLGIPRVMMFTLCSITTLAARHHISWSRMLRDKP